MLFLDLNPDDLSAPRHDGGFDSGSYLDALNLDEEGQYISKAGVNSILPKEHGGQLFSLPVIKHLDNEDIGIVVSWDSSVHDSTYLNRVTEANERVYLILKATVLELFQIIFSLNER